MARMSQLAARFAPTPLDDPSRSLATALWRARSLAACRPPARSAIHPQRPAGAAPASDIPIGIFGRLRLGTASGFTSEQMAAFRSEKVAGFVGIRIANLER